MPKKRTFSTEEAAEFLGVSVSTLETARSRAADRQRYKGPPYLQEAKGGRVVYLLEDLEAYLAKNKRDPRGRPPKKAATEQTAE